MTERNSDTTKAWKVIDYQTLLGRNIRAEAEGLALRANGPVTREGFVQVRKVDLDALKAALDAEAEWWLEKNRV